MILIVLGVTLEQSSRAMEKQVLQTEHVVLDLLGDIARVALLTGEYDDLQAHVERAETNERIRKLIIYDTRGIVVVASDVVDVGVDAINLLTQSTKEWRQQLLRNASGPLGNIAIQYTSGALEKSKKDAFEVGMFVAIFGMLAIAIIGVLTGYLMTRKLVVLSDVAQQISNGNLDVKTGLKGNDEIARLGQTFDEMVVSIKRTVAALKSRETDLKKAHGDLEDRVRERTEELAEARDQAVRASTTKSEFLANMSHGLRTPLNAIIGYSELMLEEMEYNDNDDYIGDLNKINSSGKHLLGLVNNVLDLSKIEAGKMRVHLGVVHLNSLVELVLNNTKPLLEKKQNTFELDDCATAQELWTDEAMLSQTLINLMGNAAKFTEDGKISLSIEDEARDGIEGLRFTLSDTGIGISREQISNLFEQFEQADTSYTRKYEGTGLGLTISRHFIKLLGGDIWATSEPNKGSQFYIWVPIRSVPNK